jgi:hypothetical protein
MSKEAMKLRTAAEKVVELCSERPLSLGKWFIDMSEACESLREALTKPDFWEGYVPEPDKRQQALDKKAENARELGLDYEPVCNKDPQGCWNVRCQLGKKCKNASAQQEPVAYLVDGDLYYPEEIDWESLQEQGHTVASLYTSAQRTWVGLTNNELQPIADEHRILFGGWVEDFARAIEAKLRSKNEDRN